MPALDSKQIKSFSRTLVTAMGKYFANENVQSCEKEHEIDVTKSGKNHTFFKCRLTVR